ncbi:hypothetical protein JD79_00020 [Geodermatophilus normandii]|uniref:Uncharacterized protein n=1 Tax=Geodermatophilus normandii TaxID=1137989 RepID=A0A317QE34_9ACTN|nr:hypothetical protein [Geodermatophilus normandii]PWW20896.1 hypothetical protein JD79_00020 [Geodermatophilus normandii]
MDQQGREPALQGQAVQLLAPGALPLVLSLVVNGSWAVTAVRQVVARGGGPAAPSLAGALPLPVLAAAGVSVDGLA